jgi:secreted trypsin-like serine protease
MSKSMRSSRSKSRSRPAKKRKGTARRGMPKSALPDSGAQLDPVVAQAVRDAHAAAPNDDKAFFDRLKAGVAAALPASPTGGGALSMGRAAGGRTTGARLGDDPRYVASLRALALQTANARIIGGTAVAPKDFPDCVAVGSDTLWACTGTLIAPNAVLTAAHCQDFHTRVFVGNDVTKKGKIVKVRKKIRHERFDAKFNNDLMVLILEKKVTGVKPRAMARPAAIQQATAARLVGFGSTRLDGTGSLGAKLQTDVPIVSTGCNGTVNGAADGQVYGCHLNREIVAGKPLLNHDSCKGDSGGPLFVQDAAGKWLLAGVTSRGTSLATNMCGDGGVYVRVDAYKKWIATVLGE